MRIAVAFLLALAAAAHAADAAPAPAANGAPLKVLFVTGGGYHDYPKLAPLLTEGIRQYANVSFDVKLLGKDDEVKALMSDPKLGDGYDAIVYDLCYADLLDDAMMANAKRVTREGKPTVMVHCAVHCFWKNEEWAECCGMTSRWHDQYRSFATKKAEPEHPIAKHWPADWTTPGDELYNTKAFPETSTPVLKAYSEQTKNDQVVAWVHTFGTGRVFATTLGHDQNTAGQSVYHRLLADGLLWTCGKLGDDGQPGAGYAGPKSR